MKKPKHCPRKVLTILFTLAVFCIFTVTMLIISLIVIFLAHRKILNLNSPSAPQMSLIIAIFAISSILVGTVLSAILFRIPLKPFNYLIEGMNRLTAGDYKTRIYFGQSQIGKELASSFNCLADELQNTEMLRSDFINNFSHEFKTPIVSILGFAKLLNRGNLTEEQKKEYLTIIEEESARLSSMATNVLDLTKVENQMILTDLTQFNLSEQIRTCILLLEKKWEKKHLELSINFGEHMILANEEMLKQVWINLLDNAIKFTPEGERITINIHNEKTAFTITIKNTGSVIDEIDKDRIFNKFYQGDTSHACEGTGTGLAIVKKIIELHSGRVCAESKNNETIFSVILPQQDEP